MYIINSYQNLHLLLVFSYHAWPYGMCSMRRAIINLFGHSSWLKQSQKCWRLDSRLTSSSCCICDEAKWNMARAYMNQTIHGLKQFWISSGGSVSDKNASELSEQKDIDGFLVGGASLKGDVFSKIINCKAGVPAWFWFCACSREKKRRIHATHWAELPSNTFIMSNCAGTVSCYWSLSLNMREHVLLLALLIV